MGGPGALELNCDLKASSPTTLQEVVARMTSPVPSSAPLRSSCAVQIFRAGESSECLMYLVKSNQVLKYW